MAALCGAAIGTPGATAGVKSASPLASERLLLELVKALRTQKYIKEADAASALLLAKLEACICGSGPGKENSAAKKKKVAAAGGATTADPLLTLRIVGDAAITQLKISLALVNHGGIPGLGAAARVVARCVVPLAAKVDAGDPTAQKVLATLLSALNAAASAAEKPTSAPPTVERKVAGAGAGLHLREVALALSAAAPASSARAAKAIDAALKGFIKVCGDEGLANDGAAEQLHQFYSKAVLPATAAGAKYGPHSAERVAVLAMGVRHAASCPAATRDALYEIVVPEMEEVAAAVIAEQKKAKIKTMSSAELLERGAACAALTAAMWLGGDRGPCSAANDGGDGGDGGSGASAAVVEEKLSATSTACLKAWKAAPDANGSRLVGALSQLANARRCWAAGAGRPLGAAAVSRATAFFEAVLSICDKHRPAAASKKQLAEAAARSSNAAAAAAAAAGEAAAICTAAGRVLSMDSEGGCTSEAVQWFHAALDIIVSEKLNNPSADALYQASRAVFNHLTKAADSRDRTAHLISCMEVVCKSAAYVDATNPARRVSGVLAALQSSLANLYGKAKRPGDAARAYGTAIAMLPREKLVDAKRFPQEQMDKFVQSVTKAAWAAEEAEAAPAPAPALVVVEVEKVEKRKKKMKKKQANATKNLNGVDLESAEVQVLDVMFTIRSSVQALSPLLPDDAVVSLLKLQWQCCRDSVAPEHTVRQQLQIIDDLLELVDGAGGTSAVQEGAWLRVERARLYREVGGSASTAEAAVESCNDAIAMLKSLAGKSNGEGKGKGTVTGKGKGNGKGNNNSSATDDAATSELPKTLLDDLASAYTWHGICARDCGIAGSNRSFRAAAGLWATLMSNMDLDDAGNAGFFRAPERTVALLEAVATLFGLLEQSTDQVLVFQLIELINSRVCGAAVLSNVGMVAALASAGNSMHRMGYLAVAESHFAEAEDALDGINLDYLLHHSRYLVATGNLQKSQAEIDRVVKEAKNLVKNGDEDQTPTLATAEAIAADAAFLDGHPAAAVSMADHAFRLRVAQNRTASSEAIKLSPASASTTSSSSSAGVADGSGYIAGGGDVESDPAVGGDDAAGDDHWSRVHSQWQVMSDLLESLYQMGQLHQLQGIPGASRFYFRKGLKFAEAAKLANVQIRFLLALADVHCKQHSWKDCSDCLSEATQIRAATAMQPQQGPGGKHSMKLAEIRIAHKRGDAEFAQDRPKQALNYFKKAAAELRGVMAPAYISALKTGRGVFELATEGTPNEKAVAKAWSRTSGSGGGGTANAVGGFMLSEDVVAGDTPTPPQVATNPDYPALSGELAVVLASTALSQFRCSGNVDAAMVEEALSLFACGRDESMVHYLIGLLHLEQATTAASGGASWIGCCGAPGATVGGAPNPLPSASAAAVNPQTPARTPLPIEISETPGSGSADDCPPATPVATAAPAVREAEPLEDVNISKWKVAELKAELKKRGLAIAGKKADLVARLAEDVASHVAPESELAADEAATPPNVAAEVSTPIMRTPGPTSAPPPALLLHSKAPPLPVSPASAVLSAALAKEHFMKAFKICRKFADPTMLKDICGALALLQGSSDSTQTAFYLHNGLGITARQEMVIKLMRDKRRAAHEDDASSFLHRKEPPSPTEELFSFSNVKSAGDFQRTYLDQLPADLTVCSISLDPSEKALIVSRLQRGATPTVQLLPIPLITPFSRAAASHNPKAARARTSSSSSPSPALELVVQELKDVLVTSEDVIGTAKEVLATTDVEEKGRLMSEWWLRRGKLDDRVETMLGVLENAVLGSGKTMFLGKLENQDLADLVDREAAELFRGLGVLAGPHISHPLCHRLVDGILEGLLSKDEVRGALVALLGASSDKIDAATVILRPIEKRLAAGGSSQRGSSSGTGSSGPSVRFDAPSGAGANLVPCTPRVGRVRKKGLPMQTPRAGGLAPKTPGARGGGGRGRGRGGGLAPKTPAVHQDRAPPRMGDVHATPARSARPTTTKKAFARKSRLGAGPLETPAPLSFGASASTSAAAPPPIIPFTPSTTMKKKRAHSRRPNESSNGGIQPTPANVSSAPAIFIDQQPQQESVVRKPICLILDKAVQSLPWESIPILQNAPVSRMPSLPFIVDRANAAAAAATTATKSKKKGTKSLSTGTSTSTANGVHVVDGSKTFYVLNPSKDLKSTQRAFEANFAAQEGWDGIVGRAPTPHEYKAGLVGSDVMVYCGHGAGQSFLNENQLEATNCRATTLLMGCSSGRLRDAGDFEPSGMALKYLLAGAPAVVANLWDVTDKDIDAVTATILEEWGADSDHAGLLNVVSKARDSCRLRFINGAAPVVYGLQVARDAQRKLDNR